MITQILYAYDPSSSMYSRKSIFDLIHSYAYIEFADKDAVSNSLLLNETVFKGRQLKVWFFVVVFVVVVFELC